MGVREKEAVVNMNFARIVRALWDGFEPERRAIRDWLSEQDRRVRRGLPILTRRLQTTTRCALAWLIFVILVAMICPASAAKTVIPMLALVPFILAAWVVTSGRTLAALIVVAAVPASTPLGVGAFFGLLRRAIRILGLILLAEGLIGIFLALVPLSNELLLVPLFFLFVACLCLVSFLAIKGKIRKVLVLGIIIISAIFSLGGFKGVSKKLIAAGIDPDTSQKVEAPGYREDLVWNDTVVDLTRQPGQQLDVRLQSGGFHGKIYLGKRPHEWRFQSARGKKDPTEWVAIRCTVGDTNRIVTIGPRLLTDNSWKGICGPWVWIQGHGDVRIFILTPLV